MAHGFTFSSIQRKTASGRIHAISSSGFVIGEIIASAPFLTFLPGMCQMENE